ncbi:MAG: UV DNA damage repair endonuclease UvsE [Ignavibacteriales bacterium]
MKIGYPCINLSLEGKGNKTFRLRSYSEERLIETVKNNLDYLHSTLRFNVEHQLLFFRISSDLIPFGSHPVCQSPWGDYFKEKFRAIGDFIKRNNIRISMHPDQFTLINSLDEKVYENTIRELMYHAKILDLLGLNDSAKIQIHVGGVYGDKEESIKRFIRRFKKLSNRICRRLVIENDDRLYSLEDCLEIHTKTGTPILFDVFHHELNNHGEAIKEAFQIFTGTWKKVDGVPMVDYSSQEIDGRRGNHAKTINVEHFKRFLNETENFDFDIMLEIKDKEKSALKAMEIVSNNPQFARVLERDTNI